jgi:hypothetical protein
MTMKAEANERLVVIGGCPFRPSVRDVAPDRGSVPVRDPLRDNQWDPLVIPLRPELDPVAVCPTGRSDPGTAALPVASAFGQASCHPTQAPGRPQSPLAS